MKRIQIRMKLTKDTRKECDRRRQMWQPYFEGRTRPHFKLPAVIVETGYMPASGEQEYPSAYIYVCSSDRLWSFFQKWGFVQERA